MVIQSLLPPTPNSSAHSYGAVPLEIEEGFVTHHDYKHETDEKHDTSIIDLGPSEVVDEVSVVANTINALIGVSLFAMPWGFQQAGVLGGLVILAIVGSLSYDTTRMLLVSQKHYFQVSGEVLSYPEIAASALGEVWYRVVQIATIISCVGGSTGYLIFFGETVGQALSMKSSTVLLIATIPLIMLCLIKSFRELTIFTVFGVIALVIAVFAIIIDGSTKVDPNFDDVTILKFSTLQNCLGPVTFLFTVHYTVLAMSAEILRVSPWIADKVNEEPENSFKGLTYPIALSYFLSSVFVAVLGIAGFVMYRNVVLVTDPDGNLLIGCDGHVCQNIILNLSPGIARNIVGITMSVVIVLSYVLNIAPAREHIENMILSSFSNLDEAQISTYQNVIRTMIVLGCVAVALVAPYFGSMVGAVGGLTDAFQCFVLPPMIYLQIEGSKLSSWGRAYYQFVLFWGIATILYTAITTTNDIIS